MNLEDLSLEELWELFPITFIDYDEHFPDVYRKEENIIKSLLGDDLIRISHIGSTSIKGIKTKPIVDVLLEIDFAKKDIIKEKLQQYGYILMNETVGKISFNKGYTIEGYLDEVFHIHIKRYKDCDELYFRDYLNDEPLQAKEYERLKLELLAKHKQNRDLYTEGKKEFVTKIVTLAKEKYKGRY